MKAIYITPQTNVVVLSSIRAILEGSMRIYETEVNEGFVKQQNNGWDDIWGDVEDDSED